MAKAVIYEDIMNKITMHDFISHDCNSSKENIGSTLGPEPEYLNP